MRKEPQQTNRFFEFNKIKSFKKVTPFFLFNKQAIISNLNEYKSSMPKNTEICYAMKANSEEIVLKTLKEAGASFEVASKYELELLKKIKVDPKKIIYGTAVKPANHISSFTKYGVDRFAFDSLQELEKIAKYAPGARVYLRVIVDDKSDSVFNMSEKFGSPLDNTVFLLLKALELKLVPYGISFNVGSQARNKHAWTRGIKDISHTMKELQKKGVKIDVINLGGGFPFSYQKGDGFSGIREIAKSIKSSIKFIPHKVSFIVEPGRGIVTNSYCLITSIIATNKRPNGNWLYTDAGVYNALLEATKGQGSTMYKVMTIKQDSHRSKQSYVLSGPSGDNIDIINPHIFLAKNIQVDDLIIIYDVGAYSFTLATPFNGFPVPKTYLI